MSKEYLVEPDLDFIQQVVGLGGDSVKKCFQCATCAVACPIAPEKSPFPRKEMLAASWGIKDRLVGSADIWMCHECGDCTTLCPRGAKPGDVLSAVRSAAIAEYSAPKAIAKAVNDPKMLLFVLAIPAVWFALMAFITMTMGDTMDKIFSGIGIHWYHGPHGAEAPLAHTNFISTWLVDFTFVPLAGLVTLAFALSLKRFVSDIHANAVLEGKTEKTNFNLGEYIQAIVKIIPTILLHNKFKECGENKARGNSHMMVLFGFVGCFIATGIAFILLYILNVPGPYSIVNPLKWFATIGGIAIVAGSLLMIKDRAAKEEKSSFKDWALLAMVFGLGATGLLSYLTRLADMASVTYFIYWIHLILVFCLVAYLPFSKMAHFVYRVAALGYAEYANRK